jgi:hypothetical protein
MVITGVIRPPPEIRAVADRTALYVAKNGRAFEARILKSEKAKTPKFAFLQPTSPFHAYYEDRIQFYEAGGEDGDDNDTNNKKEGAEKKENTTAAPKETTTVRKTEKTQKASAIDPIAKALLGQRNKIQQARAKQKEESKEGGENGGGTETTTPSSMPLPPPPPLELVTIVFATIDAERVDQHCLFLLSTTTCTFCLFQCLGGCVSTDPRTMDDGGGQFQEYGIVGNTAAARCTSVLTGGCVSCRIRTRIIANEVATRRR